jgi:deoxyadenosine/deoxycytidine kinase
MYIIMIVGLPGSGKTQIARTLAGGMENRVVLDNPTVKELLDVKNSKPRYLYIIDWHLCEMKNRELAKLWIEKNLNVSRECIAWRFVDKDLHRCKLNLENRGKKGLDVSNQVKAFDLIKNRYVLSLSDSYEFTVHLE